MGHDRGARRGEAAGEAAFHRPSVADIPVGSTGRARRPPVRSGTVGDEKLWSYEALARMWSWALIISASLLIVVSIGLQAGAVEGLSGNYFATLLLTTVVTCALLYPLFRVWLRGTALPSSRLPRATKAKGRRLLPASRADWVRWSIAIGVILFVGGVTMLAFLVGMLGRGGIAEGVVVGMMQAWGLATLEDSIRIARLERTEGRRYHAATRRPVAVGDNLVWTPTEPEADAGSQR